MDPRGDDLHVMSVSFLSIGGQSLNSVCLGWLFYFLGAVSDVSCVALTVERSEREVLKYYRITCYELVPVTLRALESRGYLYTCQ